MGIELASAGAAAWFWFLTVALLFGGAGLLTASFLRAAKPTNPAYQTAYECGEEPVGAIWVPFHPRYYVIAILFLLFEVEVALLYPWASVAMVKPNRGGLSALYADYAFGLGIGFILLLALGLVYAWARGSLDWKLGINPQTPQRGPLPAGAEAYKAAFATGTSLKPVHPLEQ